MQTKQQYRYNLDKTSKKTKCPDCGSKSLVLYKDSETGDYLPDHVGRCDRENRCGYHFTAGRYLRETKQNGMNNYNRNNKPLFRQPLVNIPLPPKVDFIPWEMVTASLQIKVPGRQDETDGLLKSHFGRYLGNTFGDYVTHYILERNYVGRSKIGDGTACIFWRIDKDNRVRTGKIMFYNPETGKRRKDINPTWVHRLKQGEKPLFPNFNFSLCFFGEHLLSKEPKKPVALVESEKTAIFCNYYLPDYIWLASGGASGCRWRDYEVFRVLKNRTVVLFPDFGLYNHKTGKTCFEEWQDRAETIRSAIPCKLSVSPLLESFLPEAYRKFDYDLADLFLLTSGGKDLEAINRNIQFEKLVEPFPTEVANYFKLL